MLKMSTKRESNRDKAKGKAEAKSEKERDESAKGEKQTKLDSVITQITKESTTTELIAVVNTFNKRLDQLASKEYMDKCLQKLVTENFVKTKLKELKEEMTREIKTEIKTEFDKVYERLRNVNTKLVEQATALEDLKSETSDLRVELNKVKAENSRLKTDNKDMKEVLTQRETKLRVNEKEINDLEQYTRRNSVRIYGINDQNRTESSRESGEAVIKMLKNKLDMPINLSDIDVAHRLGQFRKDGNRPIICKFVSRETKNSVLRNRRNLKGSPFVIREDLTTKNAKLLENTSQHPNVKNAWSDDGKIIALLQSGVKIRVHIHSNLERSFAATTE